MRLKNNTKKSGTARIIIIPGKDKGKDKFTAVCLDFDIIEEAKSFKQVSKQINEAVRGYIENIWKNKLSDDLLNRHAPEKYWKKYDQYRKFLDARKEKQKGISSQIKNSSLFTIPINQLSVPCIATC